MEINWFSSSTYFLQVCDPNGRWYLADGGSAPGDLLLITGKALSHATAGLRPAASYKVASDFSNSSNGVGRYYNMVQFAFYMHWFQSNIFYFINILTWTNILLLSH